MLSRILLKIQEILIIQLRLTYMECVGDGALGMDFKGGWEK